MNVPGGIQTNFMPMLFVKCLGGSFFCCAWMGRLLANATIRARQKRRVMGEVLCEQIELWLRRRRWQITLRRSTHGNRSDRCGSPSDDTPSGSLEDCSSRNRHASHGLSPHSALADQPVRSGDNFHTNPDTTGIDFRACREDTKHSPGNCLRAWFA